MQETIKIWMAKEDADTVEKIFQYDQTPNFTIVKRFELPVENSSCSQLEIVVDGSMALWHLAKRVQMEQDFEKRLEEIKQNCMKTIEENWEKINKKAKND